MPEIRILVPILDHARLHAPVAAIAGGDLRLSVACIRRGPASIESLWEEVACVEGLVELGLAAQAEGVDGLVIDCMGDPGVEVLREILDIPVLGPAQTAMGVAAMLGRKFSVLTVLERSRPLVDDQVHKYGLTSRYAGCEVVDLPVLDFCDDPQVALGELKGAALDAVRLRRADSIVLGCTGWTGLGPALQDFLATQGNPVPVIDPMPLTVRVLQGLIAERIGHSKQAYPAPKLERLG